MKTDSDRKILEKILQYAELENKHVLEVGCGDGRITSLMSGRAEKLTAVEPDAKSVRKAREKVPKADFLVGSGEGLEFPDESFDLVIFTLSLHHQDAKAALGEAARVLRAEGSILVIEPVNEGEIERTFTFLHDENRSTLKAQKAIKESGLKCERGETFDSKWIFDDRKDLFDSIFEYYGMPFDADTAAQVSELLGTKLDTRPIVLTDTMVIQMLKKGPA